MLLSASVHLDGGGISAKLIMMNVAKLIMSGTSATRTHERTNVRSFWATPPHVLATARIHVSAQTPPHVVLSEWWTGAAAAYR